MAKPRSTDSVRKLVSQAVTENYTVEDVKAIIDAAKGAEIDGIAECPNCGHTMRARVPDVKKRLDTLTGLLGQAEGKVEQAKPEATQIIIERPAR